MTSYKTKNISHLIPLKIFDTEISKTLFKAYKGEAIALMNPPVIMMTRNSNGNKNWGYISVKIEFSKTI